jgi:hypothetical protein
MGGERDGGEECETAERENMDDPSKHNTSTDAGKATRSPPDVEGPQRDEDQHERAAYKIAGT